MLILRLLPTLFFMTTFCTSAADVVRVDTQTELGDSHVERIGIGHDFYMDREEVLNRGEGYASALKRMGVRFMRYGAGDIFWSKPPFQAPDPTLALTGPQDWPAADERWVKKDRQTLVHKHPDFDQFMSVARSVNAEPVLIVTYDPIHMEKVDGRTPPTKAEAIAAAVAWIRYANIEKKYGVKYWEIGNETYLGQYYGYTTATTYAADIIEFSKAMKAVDPAIKIGAVGPSLKESRSKADEQKSQQVSWWKTVLETSAAHIDFLSVHDYPCYGWKGYAYYAEHPFNPAVTLDSVAQGLKEWGPKDRTLPIMVTEFNSADWMADEKEKVGWPHKNNLGHALVVFDMLGMYALHPNCLGALLWNTRWLKNEETPELWDALDAQNKLTAIGQALEAAKLYFDGTRVKCEAPEPLKTFAVRKDKTLTVSIINKSLEKRSARVELDGGAYNAAVKSWTGKDPDDAQPTWTGEKAVEATQGGFEVELPPHSLTVLKLTAK